MQKELLITAKIWSALSLGFMGIALIGQLFAPKLANFKDFEEGILFLFFPVGVLLGMIISWWKSHLIAGITTTICLIIFHFIRPDIGLNI